MFGFWAGSCRHSIRYLSDLRLEGCQASGPDQVITAAVSICKTKQSFSNITHSQVAVQTACSPVQHRDRAVGFISSWNDSTFVLLVTWIQAIWFQSSRSLRVARLQTQGSVTTLSLVPGSVTNKLCCDTCKNSTRVSDTNLLLTTSRWQLLALCAGKRG